MKLLILVLCLFTSACSINIGAGGSYFHDVPSDYLHGHKQFVLTAEGSLPINERWSVDMAYRHYSNGKKLGIGHGLNAGLDIVETQLKYKFDVIWK